MLCSGGLRPSILLGQRLCISHIRLAQTFAKHSQEHAGPDYLVVPFMLYNLSPEDRAIMASAMPPMVTQELVPKAWKEKWAPMQPFLLD